MNSKASKSQIQWPPLLNLANDKPHIDSTFKNWEKNNAPYLNDMISPTYIKENGTAGIYDNKGRKHQIIDGTWYVDGYARNSGYNYKFTRTVLNDNYLAYDITTDNYLIRVAYKDMTLIVSKDNGTAPATISIGDLASDSDIIDIRIKADGDNSFYVVLLYKGIGGITKIAAYEGIVAGTIYQRVNEQAFWSQQTITTSSPSFNNNITNPGSIDPIINICKVGSQWAFSVFSNYGAAVDSRYNYYISYFNSTRVKNVLIPENATYRKHVWWRGTSTVTRNQNSKTVSLQGAMRWSRLKNMNWVHFWVHIDSSEEAATGLREGYYPIYDCPNSGDYSRDYLAAVREIYVDSNDRRTSLPASIAWDVTGTNNCVIREIDSGTYHGEVDGLQLLKTQADWDYDCTGTIIYPSIVTTTESSTLEDDVTEHVQMKWQVSNNYDATMYLDFGTSDGTTIEGRTVLYDANVRLGAGLGGNIIIVHANDDWDIDYISTTFTLPDGSTASGTNVIYIDYTTTIEKPLNVGATFCLPCVFLDNGFIYNISAFTQSSSTLVNLNNKIGILSGSGSYSINNDGTIQVPVIDDMINLDDTGVNGFWNIRSNSFIFQQNYIAQMYKFTTGTITPAELAAGTVENQGAYNLEIYNSNVTDLKVQPGSSRYTGFNYYGDFLYHGSTTGAPEDRLVYCTIGARTKINNNDGDNCFNALLNTTTDNTCFFQGLSWANGDDIGTLITPWQEVSEDFYIAARGNKCIYKTKYDEIVLIERTAGFELTPVNNNKFIICNTDNYWNLYDSERDRWFHYASDWNFRVLGGYEGIRALSSTESVSNTHRMYFADAYTFWFRNIGASVNNTIARTASRTNFSNPNIYPVASWQTPVYAKARLYTEELSFYGANEPDAEDTEVLGIDVYYTKYPNVTTSGIGDAYYQFTYVNGNEKFKSNLNGVTYVITSSSTMFINPSLLATYLDGAGNNDLIRDLKEYYTQNYYNNKPTFIYAVSSEVNGADAFFVIQGQFYAIIGNKICSVSYSDSVLTSKDPIIDINGMKFLGNTPMIAFFWSDRYKAFYSFTGDASLEHLYNGSKFSNGISGDHYYDYSTQTIYVPTDKGLLCFGPKNTYILERFKDTTNVQFTDDNITHITDNGNDYSLVYYPEDGYQVYNVNLESSFFGIGATESTSIDRWNITLYDTEGTHPAGEVKYGVRSITDITVKSEDKTLKITPDMWDKWSNSVLIAYNPKLIKGQGLRLYVDSPFIIQQITAHVMDNGTGTAVNKRASV